VKEFKLRKNVQTKKGKENNDDVLHKKDKEVVLDAYICVGVYGNVEGRGKGE
jgi:hypothetical protein